MKDITALRAVLGRTIEGVLDGTVSIEQARAVALVAGEVNATAKLEVDMARATDGAFGGSGFIVLAAPITERQKMLSERK